VEDHKNNIDFFKAHLGQTNEHPFLIEVDKAEGVFIYDKQGKKYFDMIAGVAVNNIGHCHVKVIEAIQNQIKKHLHVMVYGEFIQTSQLQLAKKLNRILPDRLNSSYFLNSGTEANEAAIKLARKVTSRFEIISFKGSYHGNTTGSMSISHNEVKKSAFRPLMPGTKFIELNNFEDLEKITTRSAAVFLETVQGDAGVRIPTKEFLSALRNRCNQTDTLLVFDEIQCGLGRTGKNFSFEHFDVVPDILTLGKALGGGMSIGALVSDLNHMNQFRQEPMLGHITTFGGHPVNCAAACAFLDVLTTEVDYTEVEKNAVLLEEIINQSEEVLEIRRIGMMYAIDMESDDRVAKVVDACLERGLIAFWFLSHPNSFRLSPPINISKSEIEEAGQIILESIESTK
jgi:acetylornithine/succinyldiaminopimelate/putrescine aminotransferase